MFPFRNDSLKLFPTSVSKDYLIELEHSFVDFFRNLDQWCDAAHNGRWSRKDILCVSESFGLSSALLRNKS